MPVQSIFGILIFAVIITVILHRKVSWSDLESTYRPQTTSKTKYSKPLLNCEIRPVDVLPGINKLSLCQKDSTFHKTKVGLVEYIDLENSQVDKRFVRYFPPYNISRNPQLELESCVLRDYPCKTFPQTESTWNLITEDLYRQNVVKGCSGEHAGKLHTSNRTSETTFINGKSCSVGEEINLNLVAKDSLGNLKTYGGDFILARMVKATYPNYYDVKYLKSGIYDHYDYNSVSTEDSHGKPPRPHVTMTDTIIPGHVIDKRNGNYSISIPCKFSGKFRIEIFILRTSEMMTALTHSFKTLHNKGGSQNRFINSQFMNEQYSPYCDPILPDMLPGGNRSNVCPIYQDLGKEWYCERPAGVNGTCDENNRMKRLGPFIWKKENLEKPPRTTLDVWTLHDLFSKCGLEKTHEDLVFSSEIDVKKQEATARHSSESHTKISGYFHNGAWHATNLPSVAQKIHYNLHSLLKNKIIIRMGDSILRHLLLFWYIDLKDLIDHQNKISPSLEPVHSQPKIKEGDKNRLPLDLQNSFPETCPPPPSGDKFLKQPLQELNLTTYTFTHGLPYFTGLKPTCVGHSQFSPNILEKMIEHKWFGEEYIILLDHGAHFANWHPIILYNRLVLIKEAARKYKKFSPKTPIIFKTLNYIRGDNDHTYGVTSGVVPLWQREMVFKIFGNPYLNDMYSKNNDDIFPVKVLDVYPMSLAAFDHFEIGNVHPLETIGRETGHMLINLLYKLEYFN